MERQNRTAKALAIAAVLHESGVSFTDALAVRIGQGPFWETAVKAAGRPGSLSEETRKEALYYLAAMHCRKSLRRVK